MSSNDLKLAKQYKKALTDLGIPIDDVIIFGSRAINKTNKWSDLDICVVSPAFNVDRVAERVLLSNIARKISDQIEPHPTTREELNNKFNALSNEIQKHGLKA